MKTQIENIPVNNENAHLEFQMLLAMCLTCDNEKELRYYVSTLDKNDFDNYIFGLGSSHFWASSIITKTRILLTEF